MKKALRLLAMVMAVVMIMSAACLPTYAKNSASEYDEPARYSGVLKYYFTAEQGCSYVLDMIDEMLANENINPTWDDIGAGSFDGTLTRNLGVSSIDLRSIDNAVDTLYTLLYKCDTNSLIGFLDFFTVFGNVLDSDIGLVQTHKYLDTGLKRNNGASDLDVLYMLINWLGHLDTFLKQLVNGKVDMGLLGSALGDYEQVIDDFPGFIKKILYNLLVDSNFDYEKDSLPDGFTVDGAVQQVVDWALITGTGETTETGAASLLGANTEPLLPALGNDTIKAAGGASITAVSITADRGNGKVQTTMNTYQLVSNAIDALMSGTVKDMLMELLVKELKIDEKANNGKGNTDIMTDMTFTLIVGAVEELFVQNGAPEITYSADAQTYPIPKLNELMDWLLTGTDTTAPAINTFISLSYKGINLTDNFMSLLNDVARMLPSLLPAFGLELDSSLAYSASDLAATLAMTENKEIVFSGSEGATTDLYLTYEEDATGERMRIYPSEYETDKDGNKTPSKYAYFADGSLVNTVDSSKPDYVNPDLIRPEYYISDAKVYANLIKLLLSSMIDGIYFPEWTEDISSVAAYALAAVAMNIVPDGEWYDRLDAYHYNITHTDSYVSAATGKTIDKSADLDYTTIKTDSDGRTIEIVYAAGEIGAAIGAYYLNGILDIQAGEQLTVLGSSLEQFAFEFLLWAFKKYLPIFAGTYNATTGRFSNEGTWSEVINSCLDQVYLAPTSGKATVKTDANWNAVYTLIDTTLFNLVPTSWFPATYNDSFDFINKWLLDSVQNFDLQQLFSLFSVREGGELDTQPLLTVLIRVIDRVLAIVCGGNSVLLPERNNMFSVTSSVNFYESITNITSLDTLLDRESLAFFLPRLLTKLNEYKVQLCTTIFPLLMSKFLPEFDAGTDNQYSGTNYLGTDLTKYKIANLQNYLDTFNVGVNATVLLTTTDEDAAKAKVKANSGSYISTKTLNGVKNYTVYMPVDFITCATETSGLTDSATYTDADGNVAGDTTYSTFSAFSKATLNKRTASNALVSYTKDAYRFVEIEDFSNAFSYNNYQDALDDAQDFVNDYNAFGTGKEASGYYDWMKFYINSNLKANSVYDANDDGVIDSNDGDPGAPKSSYYPFSTTASQNIDIYYAKKGSKVTVNMNEFNSSLYEQIKIGLEYAADPEHDVALSSLDAEPVVRLALKKAGTDDARVLAFDITPDADGNYHDGAYQWSGLTDAELQAITSFCATIDWTFTYDKAEGTYEITRPAFALISSDLDFGNGISTTPPTTKPEDNKDIVSRTANRMYDCYVDYITELYSTRRDLYSHMNIIGKRVEMAEDDRKGNAALNVTSLQWLLKHVESEYINTETGKRNREFSGAVEKKIYTASSYATFKQAYDFATSLVNAKYAASAAEGLTQSMVSKAFDALMDAYRGLVEFTGDADWYKMEQTLALAQPFMDNKDPYNQETGYTKETYDALVESYKAAKAYYDNKAAYDCEQQNTIDAAADDLYAKIFEIVYNTKTDLKILEGSSFVKTQKDNIVDDYGNITYQGWITGLTEGYGLISDRTASDTSINDSDNVMVIGMTVNDSKNMTFKVSETDHGYGTGAYYVANDGSRPKFFYYAVLYGDLNGDTVIDGTDKTMLDWYLGGNSSFLDPQQLEAADVNHDGKVDTVDAKIIKGYYTLQGDTISQTK